MDSLISWNFASLSLPSQEGFPVLKSRNENCASSLLALVGLTVVCHATLAYLSSRQSPHGILLSYPSLHNLFPWETMHKPQLEIRHFLESTLTSLQFFSLQLKRWNSSVLLILRCCEELASKLVTQWGLSSFWRASWSPVQDQEQIRDQSLSNHNLHQDVAPYVSH